MSKDIVKCSRCMRDVPKPEAKRHKIWYRTREWKPDRHGRMKHTAVNKSRYQYFCSGQCAANEQMSNEG